MDSNNENDISLGQNMLREIRATLFESELTRSPFRSEELSQTLQWARQIVNRIPESQQDTQRSAVHSRLSSTTSDEDDLDIFGIGAGVGVAGHRPYRNPLLGQSAVPLDSDGFATRGMGRGLNQRMFSNPFGTERSRIFSALKTPRTGRDQQLTIPRLSNGKFSFQPTATFRNAPKAYPAKPQVEGFSQSHEKASAAAKVLQTIKQTTAHRVIDGTIGPDIFTHFWVETTTIDSPEVAVRPGTESDQELLYFDESALNSDRGLQSARTDVESTLSTERTVNGSSGHGSARDLDLNDTPNSFADFVSLLENRPSRVSSDIALGTRGSRILQPNTTSSTEDATFDLNYAQWDSETRSSNLDDIFSNFWDRQPAHDSRNAPTRSISVNTELTRNELNSPNSAANAGERILYPRGSWQSATGPTESRPEISSRWERAEETMSSIQGLMARQRQLAHRLTEMMNISNQHPRHQTGTDSGTRVSDIPRSFLDRSDSLPNFDDSEDDEESSSVFSRRIPTSDLTPDSLFQPVSREDDGRCEHDSQAVIDSLPDEYFFSNEEHNYHDFCRGRKTTPRFDIDEKQDVFAKNGNGSSVTTHGNEEYEASAEGLLTVNANELAWSESLDGALQNL